MGGEIGLEQGERERRADRHHQGAHTDVLMVLSLSSVVIAFFGPGATLLTIGGGERYSVDREQRRVGDQDVALAAADRQERGPGPEERDDAFFGPGATLLTIGGGERYILVANAALFSVYAVLLTA
jgi:hypothetical protein